MVQRLFRDGSDMFHRWFKHALGIIPVQRWSRDTTHYSSWIAHGSEMIQRWFRDGPEILRTIVHG